MPMDKLQLSTAAVLACVAVQLRKLRVLELTHMPAGVAVLVQEVLDSATLQDSLADQAFPSVRLARCIQPTL